MNTESTSLGPIVNNPSSQSSGTGEAIGEQPLPEREEITLQPSKEFPRRLTITWEPRSLSVTLATSKFQMLAWTSAQHAHVRLVTHQSGIATTFHLWTDESSYKLSQREFETLRVKLQPRGVRVETV